MDDDTTSVATATAMVGRNTTTNHSNDIHLPSMVPLSCKNSQQLFFLRLLKVVCQLRESALTAATANKCKTPCAHMCICLFVCLSISLTILRGEILAVVHCYDKYLADLNNSRCCNTLSSHLNQQKNLLGYMVCVVCVCLCVSCIVYTKTRGMPCIV